MAVNLTNADNALKSVYLDAISEQLNSNVNPFLAQIEKSTDDVWGKEVKKLAVYGMNGGVGAGSEDGDLPTAGGNNYKQFVTTLKNLYGVIEISDKAIRASENNTGAFVSLLNAEMDGLIKSSKFNFGRMLFGDGSGTLAKVVLAENGVITVDNVKNLIEGMIVDFREQNGNAILSATGRRIISIDRANGTIKVSGANIDGVLTEGALITIQGSFNNEITGLQAIFNQDKDELYGLKKSENSWLSPYVQKETGEISEMKIQTALDVIEEQSGGSVNFIVCSWGVRRAIQNMLSANKSMINTMDLAGGFKALSYNGIPIVADRFCPEGTMYLLNTNDFILHQLCDWQWLTGDDGKVLKQIPGKPVYTATLVKYAELICSRPNGQGALYGITEA
ncbi:MAG: phage major capsid protein [Clostridiales bacterium]|nr:phage major capsid protein [Clostridiales bacterium]